MKTTILNARQCRLLINDTKKQIEKLLILDENNDTEKNNLKVYTTKFKELEQLMDSYYVLVSILEDEFETNE